ncbi:MAG: N-acetylmuramoyl-L-alanine amidase [Verrucomicrobiota bacterium]
MRTALPAAVHRSRLFRWSAAWLLLMAWPTVGEAAIRTIVLDAGHGGKDRGAYSANVFEKHLALDVTFRVDAILRSRGYRVVLTRRRDEYPSLWERVRLANRYSKAVFVSIHFNSARWKPSVQGVETYYYGADDRALAAAIQPKVVSATGAPNRGIKRARFFVLRNSKIPAALVECGFLTNASERKKCMKGYYRQQIAEGIAAGIISYARRN